MTQLLDYDPDEAVAHLREVDATMAAIIDEAGPFTLQPDPARETYPYLVRSIVFQQLNGTAAATIHRRLLELWPEEEHPTPEQLLDASPEHLRTAGISANKAAALHDVALGVLDGRVPDRATSKGMADAELERALTSIRGVGPWTVHMLQMFQLGRGDILPVGDYGVRAGYALRWGLAKHPTPGELKAAAEPWRPYRTVASWYLWRAVDL